MNYIGIRGHRGAGKNSVSYLLGNTIDHLICNGEKGFEECYNAWVDNIMTSEQVLHECSLQYVYFDAFSDTLKMFIELLLGCKREYLYNDYYKDHTIVNIKDFSYKVYDEIPNNLKILSKDELYAKMPKESQPTTITKNLYITLRDFILYFGMDVMQRYFGLNVWVKSLKSNESTFESMFNDDDCYKVYTDVKTPSEVTYIKDKNGIIIKVVRPSHKKGDKGFDKLSNDNRYDYTVKVNGNLYELKDEILNIAKQIINNDKSKI